MDRISSLPDELLINILNHLPTKYAFLTSVLSRRWSYLFKEVNHLDFDDTHVCNSHSTTTAIQHNISSVAFKAFVCKMLDCIKLSNLRRFRIKVTKSCDWSIFGGRAQWFNILLSRNIPIIDLCVDAPVGVTDSVFTCKTLCIIKLNVFSVDIPDSICMPCLKILHLKTCTILDADSINRIFPGCPLLHEFCIEPTCNGPDQLSISGPSLKNLKLHNRYCGLPGLVVAIVAPLLQSFHFVDNLAKSYSIMTSKNLVEAHLEIFIRMEDFEDMSAISLSTRELIQGVSSVKCLFLSFYYIDVILFHPYPRPIFYL